MVLSASVYQVFVLAEVLLNNSHVWYPKWLSGFLERLHGALSKIVAFLLRRITVKVNRVISYGFTRTKTPFTLDSFSLISFQQYPV